MANGREKWKGMETTPVPPSCCHLPGKAAALKCLNTTPQDLLTFALKVGTWLSVANIKKIFLQRGWPYPAGTGKKGSRLKIDFVNDMISRLHGTASEEEQTRMRSALLGSYSKKSVTDNDKCDTDMLNVIAALDPENAQAAKGIRKESWDRLAARKKAEVSMRLEAPSGWHKEHFTPRELRSLLPPTSATCWLKRQPAIPQYSGFYDRNLESCFMFYWKCCSPACLISRVSH